MSTKAGVQVWVSKKWRFIFIRQPKSSSTAVMVAIKSQLCGLADPSNVNNCDPDQFAVAEDITDAMWREFFVFTIVRNPWTRLLSAHTMFTKHFLKKCGLRPLSVPCCFNGAHEFGHCLMLH
jgi:Sulfotransferase family